MKKGLVSCLVFMLLFCFSVFAVTVADLKPDDVVKDLNIIAPPAFYKEEVSSMLIDQPFFSYKDVDATFFVYNSSMVESPKGYDILVIFEDWKNETSAKLRFERDFKFEEGFLKECDMMFGRRVKKCEKGKYPELVYVMNYQKFLIRIQPHPDYSFSTQGLHYLSSDMQALIGDILFKISKFENPVEGKEVIRNESAPVRPIVVAEEEQVPEGIKPGFFSRNKDYIIAGIILFLILLWVYGSKNFSWGFFLIILGLIIFNKFTGFSKGEVVTWSLLWIMTYFFFEWFYMHNIKKYGPVRKKTAPKQNQ